MEISSMFHSKMALSSPLFSSSSFPTSSRKRPNIHKFKLQSSTSAATKITTDSIPRTEAGEFQNVLTDYVSPNSQFPVSRNDRQSAILQIQESSDLGSALPRLGETLKVQDMNVILRYFGKLSRRQELSQVFDWMQQNQKINVASYSSYVKLMGKSLSSVEALEMYRSIKDRSTKINVSVCNALLSCLVKNGKSESSLKLFTQMKRDGLVPDVVTYSTLLAGCAKVKDGYSKALELVQELMSNGLLMDSVTYGSLLSVCASHKECNEAEKYFQKMKAEGQSPNVYHYSSLLNAYSVDGNYEKAEALIEEMRSAGLVLNKVVYTTLLKVYVKGGLFEKSKELLKELEAFGYARDEMPFCLLMDGLVKSGLLLEAKSVFDEMMGKHVKTGMHLSYYGQAIGQSKNSNKICWKLTVRFSSEMSKNLFLNSSIFISSIIVYLVSFASCICAAEMYFSWFVCIMLMLLHMFKLVKLLCDVLSPVSVRVLYALKQWLSISTASS